MSRVFAFVPGVPHVKGISVMPWLIDLTGQQLWAREAIAALSAGGVALAESDAPAGGSSAGIIFSASDSQDLRLHSGQPSMAGAG